jgi:hypothetical protein
MNLFLLSKCPVRRSARALAIGERHSQMTFPRFLNYATRAHRRPDCVLSGPACSHRPLEWALGSAAGCIGYLPWHVGYSKRDFLCVFTTGIPASLGNLREFVAGFSPIISNSDRVFAGRQKGLKKRRIQFRRGWPISQIQPSFEVLFRADQNGFQTGNFVFAVRYSD